MEIKYLVNKFDLYHNSKFIKWIKKYPKFSEALKALAHKPELYGKVLDGTTHNLDVPKEYKKIFPKRQKLFQLYYYLLLKMKYALMEVKYR